MISFIWSHQKFGVMFPPDEYKFETYVAFFLLLNVPLSSPASLLLCVSAVCCRARRVQSDAAGAQTEPHGKCAEKPKLRARRGHSVEVWSWLSSLYCVSLWVHH